MPLPVKSKAGIGYSFQPPFSQQLGIWTRSSSTAFSQRAFFNAIPRQLRVLDLHMHPKLEQLELSDVKWSNRSNFILHLHNTYEELYKNYNKNRQRDLAKANKKDLTISNDLHVDTLIQAYRDNVGLGIGTSEQLILAKLAPEIQKRNHGFILSLSDRDNQLHAGGLFVYNQNRIINLFPVTTALGKKSGAATMLYDHLIRSYQSSSMVLDFEGSMIPTVARFYQSFGSEEEQYWRIHRNLLIWPFQLAYWLYTLARYKESYSSLRRLKK